MELFAFCGSFNKDVGIATRKISALLCSLALLLQSVAALATSCSMQPELPQSSVAVASSSSHCHCDPGGPERECCKKPIGNQSSKQLCKNQSDCKCEVRAPSDQVKPVTLAAPLTVEHAAILVSPIFGQVAIAIAPRQVLYGTDSGPPLPIDQAPDLGRAPPVA